MTVQEIQRFTFQRDGVRYSIHVEQKDEGIMWGTWNCHDCGLGGTASKSSSSIREAAAAAGESLEIHHNMYHPTR